MNNSLTIFLEGEYYTTIVCDVLSIPRVGDTISIYIEPERLLEVVDVTFQYEKVYNESHELLLGYGIINEKDLPLICTPVYTINCINKIK